MGIFYLFFIFIIFSALFFKISQTHKVNKKPYIYFCGIGLFLISGLRHETVGNDTISYIENFKTQNQKDWNSIFENVEPGYSLLVKFLSTISDNSNFFLAGVALIFTVSICFLIYKYSKDHLLSFILLITLGIFYFSMAGLRQIIAMSILMFSIKFVRDRKILPFLLLVFIACLFHNTAICFILIYIISYLRISWKHLLVFFGVIILVYYNQNDIVSFIFKSLALDRLSHYENVDSTLSLSGFFIQLVIATYCLVYYKITIKRDAKNIVFYNLMFLGVLFQMFTPIIGEFFRLSLYFNVFNIILIPNVLMSKNQNNTWALEYLSLLLIFLMYFTFSSQGNIISEYKFFWQ
jgi:hypothetical protein